MNQKPKAALDTLKKGVELGEKAINTLEEYVVELEKKLGIPKSQRPKSESQLDDEEQGILEQMKLFVPKTVEDEYRNKLFIRLMNNFTLSQLEFIEKEAIIGFKKEKTYKDH